MGRRLISHSRRGPAGVRPAEPPTTATPARPRSVHGHLSAVAVGEECGNRGGHVTPRRRAVVPAALRRRVERLRLVDSPLEAGSGPVRSPPPELADRSAPSSRYPSSTPSRIRLIRFPLVRIPMPSGGMARSVGARGVVRAHVSRPWRPSRPGSRPRIRPGTLSGTRARRGPGPLRRRPVPSRPVPSRTRRAGLGAVRRPSCPAPGSGLPPEPSAAPRGRACGGRPSPPAVRLPAARSEPGSPRPSGHRAADPMR